MALYLPDKLWFNISTVDCDNIVPKFQNQVAIKKRKKKKEFQNQVTEPKALVVIPKNVVT